MPKVSIIIPIYNQDEYLRDCLDSAVDQDIEDYEILLVNDGSTDDSEKICKEYMERYSQITYVYKENGGLGSARNAGIKAAVGDYVLFLDADDKVESNSLNLLYQFADKNAFDLVYFDIYVTDCDLQNRTIRPVYSKMTTIISRQDAFAECLSPAFVWARLYRAELIRSELFQSMWYEDMDWFPRVLSNAQRIGYYKVPCYYYRQHGKSITHQADDLRNLEAIDAWKSGLDICGLTENEHELLRREIRKSICSFCFYREKFASEYLEFYAKFLKDPKGNSTDIKKNKLRHEDLNIWNQAQAVNDWEVSDILLCLENVYEIGGWMIFKGDKFVAEAYEDKELILNSELKPVALHTVPHDCALVAWYEFWRHQNLISLKGKIKKIPYEKELLYLCMQEGYEIQIR